MSRYSSTERIGVNATESTIINNLDWIFREQPIVDMGIDAHIESVNNGIPTGKLIGVQIKTGESHFNVNGEYLIYYGKIIHLDYWMKHSLPIILVAHLPRTDETYWVHITEQTIERTTKGWKVLIPRNQLLDSNAKHELNLILEGTDADIKMRNLMLNLGNMKFLQNEGKLVVTHMDWHHKSYSRGPVSLIKINSSGDEEVIMNAHPWYTKYSVQEMLEILYPWASLEIDAEYYDENFSSSFYVIYTDEYIKDNPIYPYATKAGEVSYYRLELKLNLLGTSFLEVMKYIDNNEIIR